MSSIVRAARIGVGGISTLLSLLMLALIQRQFSMWNITQDGYYILSTGLYVVVLMIFLIGVSWGLKTGKTAERIWKATGGLVTSIVSFATVYYAIDAFILGGGVNEIYSAGVSISTMTAALLIFFFVLGVSKTKLS